MRAPPTTNTWARRDGATGVPAKARTWLGVSRTSRLSALAASAAQIASRLSTGASCTAPPLNQGRYTPGRLRSNPRLVSR